jgi:hypothetical protein
MQQVQEMVSSYYDLDICEFNIEQEWEMFTQTFTDFGHWLEFAEFGKISESKDLLHPALRARIILVLTLPNEFYTFTVPDMVKYDNHFASFLEYENPLSMWNRESQFIELSKDYQYMPKLLAIFNTIIAEIKAHPSNELVYLTWNCFLNFMSVVVLVPSMKDEATQCFMKLFRNCLEIDSAEFTDFLTIVFLSESEENPCIEIVLSSILTSLRLEHKTQSNPKIIPNLCEFLQTNFLKIVSTTYAPSRDFVVDTKLDYYVVSIIDELITFFPQYSLLQATNEQIVSAAKIMYEIGDFTSLNNLYNHFTQQILHSEEIVDFFEFIDSDDVLDGTIEFSKKEFQYLLENQSRCSLAEVETVLEKKKTIENYFSRFR